METAQHSPRRLRVERDKSSKMTPCCRTLLGSVAVLDERVSLPRLPPADSLCDRYTGYKAESSRVVSLCCTLRYLPPDGLEERGCCRKALVYPGAHGHGHYVGHRTSPRNYELQMYN